MIVSAVPKAQHDSFKRKIERQILEIESRIVPGLAKATAQLLREQVLALENKLKPADDKRNPAYYRPKRKAIAREPVYHWSQADWIAAKWGAKQRSGGVCEICKANPFDMLRMHTRPPDQDISRDHVEAVCAVCADQVPRETML
jgi:hypothetical protein